MLSESLAWKLVFDSLWKSFERRFDGILQSLSRHRDLVDREAISFDIIQAKSWRRQMQGDLQEREKERTAAQFRDAVTWLAVYDEDRGREEELDRRLHKLRTPGTCEWVLRHPKIIRWASDTVEQPVLWLYGKPGSGTFLETSRILKSTI